MLRRRRARAHQNAAHFLLLIWAATTCRAASGRWISRRLRRIEPSPSRPPSPCSPRPWRSSGGSPLSPGVADTDGSPGARRMLFRGPARRGVALRSRRSCLCRPRGPTSTTTSTSIGPRRCQTSYSTPSTVVAKEIARLGPTTITESPPCSGRPVHPVPCSDLSPVLAKRFDWTIDVPASTTNDTVYLLDNANNVQDWLRQLYPDATFRDFTPPPGGEPVAFEAIIPRDQVLAAQGTTPVHAADGATVRQREPALDRLVASATDCPAGCQVDRHAARARVSWYASLIWHRAHYARWRGRCRRCVTAALQRPAL